MTVVFRLEQNTGQYRVEAQYRAEAQPLGSGMRIVSSPWEGIYLEQAYSFLSAQTEGTLLRS